MRDICYIPYCREKDRCLREDHDFYCGVTLETGWSLKMAKAALNDRSSPRLAVDNDCGNDEWLTRWIGKTILVSNGEEGGDLQEVEVCYKNKNAILVKWIFGNTGEVPAWLDPIGFCAKWTFYEEIKE